MNRLFLPYDIYERHKKVGSFIEDGEAVLDVGGALNQLSQFCNPSKIIVANVRDSQEKSDIIIKKNKLPFKNSSFSIVCSIDVLEHIPQKNRKRFIEDLTRIASKKVILSFPIGTKNHIEYEKEIQLELEKTDKNVTYLKEHIRYGLPTPEEIKNLTKDQNSNTVYSGDLKINKLLFKIFLFDPQIKLIRKLIYSAKLVFNLITNPFFYDFLSQKKYTENVVRAYLIIKK